MPGQKKLTGRQRAFVLEYCRTFNGTQSAIVAGYSKKTAHAIAWENLRKPELQIAIEAEFRQRAIGLDQVIARLTEQATANVGDFIVVNPDGDRITFDAEAIKRDGRLVKRVKAKTTVRYTEKGDQIEYTTLEIELYDAQHALEVLGKHLGLVSGRYEVNWREELTEAIKDGQVEWRDASRILGRDLATALFVGAGIPVAAIGVDQAAGDKD
jgi:phage terminase small subunit